MLTVTPKPMPIANIGIAMNTKTAPEKNNVVVNSVRWLTAAPDASNALGIRAEGAYNPKTLASDHSAGIFRTYDASDARQAADMGAFLTRAQAAIPDFSALKSNLPADALDPTFLNKPKYQRLLAGMTANEFLIGGTIGERAIVYKGNTSDVSPALRQVVEGLKTLGSQWKPGNP